MKVFHRLSQKIDIPLIPIREVSTQKNTTAYLKKVCFSSDLLRLCLICSFKKRVPEVPTFAELNDL